MKKTRNERSTLFVIKERASEKSKEKLIPRAGKASHVHISLLSFRKVTGLIRLIIHHLCVRTHKDVAILIKGLTVLERK